MGLKSFKTFVCFALASIFLLSIITNIDKYDTKFHVEGIEDNIKDEYVLFPYNDDII